MKPLQILSIVATLLIAVGLVAWLADSAPTAIAPSVGSSTTTDKTETTKKPDFENKNPFDLDYGGPYPVATVTDNLYDFGNMLIGETGHHDFVIQNTGKAPLKIERGPTMCKCTLSGLAANEVPPGESAKVHLEWKPEALGQFGQSARIWTNDPENPVVDFRVEGIMHPKLILEPTGGWLLGTVPKDESKTFTGGVYSAILDDFEITKLESSNDSIELTTRPMTEEELKERETKVGHVIEGTLNPDGTVGNFREQISIRTNIEGFENIETQLTANRTGPLRIVAKGWYSGRQLLDIGKVDQAKGKTVRLTMMFQQFDGDLEFTDIVSTPPFLDIKLKREESSAKSKQIRCSCVVSVPPGSPVSDWGKSNQGSILIKTNHPEVSEISMVVEMDIQPSRD